MNTCELQFAEQLDSRVDIGYVRLMKVGDSIFGSLRLQVLQERRRAVFGQLISLATCSTQT